MVSDPVYLLMPWARAAQAGRAYKGWKKYTAAGGATAALGAGVGVGASSIHVGAKEGRMLTKDEALLAGGAGAILSPIALGVTAGIFFLGGDPIAGTYLIPTKVLPLWKDLPEKVKHLDTGELMNTQEYLQTVLTDIVKANGEGKTTMGALTHIIDAEVFKILNQDATQEEINNVIRSTVVVDDDGQGFTELGVHRTFEELKNMIEATEGKFKDVTIDSLSDDLKEKYKEWGLTQNSDEVIVEEESQDVSKMNLSEATEKNLITADYLNNLSYEAPGGAQQEMFRTGGNNMMSVGDIITTKDGKKYESYHDTVKNEYDRDVTTIRFRPITEVKVPTTDEEFVGGTFTSVIGLNLIVVTSRSYSFFTVS
jgi:hypothetical protein